MNKYISAGVFLLFLLLLMPVIPSRAADATTVTVSETAAGFEIQEALDMAKQREYDGNLTVIVPEGTHILTKKLRIYSNTTLKLLDGAVMEAHFLEGENGANGLAGAMLYASHVNDEGKTCTAESCNHGGYSRFQNITVEGGVWDRCSDTNPNWITQVMSFRYGQNLTLRNIVVKNATEHFINVSATKNTVIDNVTFRDQVVHGNKKDTSFWGSYTSTAARYAFCEVLHVDYLNDVYNPGASESDFVGCKNITVKNCLFENVWAGLGTHHKRMEISDGVTIRGNRFRNVRGRCIGVFGYRNLTIRDNSFSVTEKSSTAAFIYSYACTGVIENNTADGAYQFLNSVGGDSCTVKGNRITNTTDSAILINDCPYSVTVSGNTLVNSGSYGIRVMGVSKAVITGNQLLGTAKQSGISVTGKSVVTIRENTIQNTKRHGITVYSSGKDSLIFKNRLDNIGITGILIDSCGSGYQVRENTIDDTKYYDVLVKGTKKCTVAENACYFTKGNLRYKVTTDRKYVTLIGTTKKTMTSVTIPLSLKKGYSTYRVTAIGKNAFLDCRKLQTITVNTKSLVSVGKNAWKNIHPKAKIKVPEKYLKTYQKLFKNKGQGKKVKIIKK